LNSHNFVKSQTKDELETPNSSGSYFEKLQKCIHFFIV